MFLAASARPQRIVPAGKRAPRAGTKPAASRWSRGTSKRKARNNGLGSREGHGAPGQGRRERESRAGNGRRQDRSGRQGRESRRQGAERSRRNERRRARRRLAAATATRRPPCRGRGGAGGL